MKAKQKRGSNRARPPFRCTIGGCPLPQDSKLGWGLAWDEKTGVCAECLYKVRKSIGYFERKKRNENNP